MEPPFGDSPTIPMLPPHDGAPQQPQPNEYPPQYPPAPAPAQWQQASYPSQMAPYAPRVRQSVAGQHTSSRAGAHPTRRMPHIQALALAGRLKRWSIGLAVAAFVTFVGLAAGHVTGVTAAQAGSSATPNTNASQQNNGDDGGFFGGEHNNGNNGGGFFGSGSSGSPSSGTGVS